MSKSIFGKPNTASRQTRNGFDLSFHRNYTTPLGAILPVFHDLAIVGDKYRLNSASFVRTEPLEKAAFARFKLHVDWFFVPMEQLYSRWNEFYNLTYDVMSNIFTPIPSTGYQWPLFQVLPTLGVFHTQSISGFSTFVPGTSSNPIPHVTYTSDDFGVPKIWNFRRLWDMFGYGSLSRRYSPWNDDENYTLIPFLAYHKIYHSHYRPTNWFANNPSLFNVDDLYKTPVTTDVKRIVDICSTIHYRKYRNDFFTNVMPNPTYNSSFADYLQFTNPGFNVLNPEISNSNASGTTSFNLYGSVSGGSNQSAYRFGLAGSDSNTRNLVSGLYDSSFSGSSGGNSPRVVNFTARDSSGNDISIGSSSPSAADLRTIFAFDKFLRVTAFAGSHYQDQVLAHYGIKIPEGISNEAYFLGSQSTPILVNEVVATSSTGANENGSPLAGSTIGDIAGKGFGNSSPGKDIEFTCPCDGVILGLQSIELIPDYSSMFCDRQLRYQSTWDFYHPEFDGIGMQPMVVDQFGFNPQDSNSVEGWQYRYSEYKTKVDVTNEGFWDTNRYNWCPTKQSAVLGPVPGDGQGTVHASRAYNFFVFPQSANSIFLKKFPYYYQSNMLTEAIEGGLIPYYSGAASSQNCYENDPFLVSMDLKCFKTSVMSVFSLDKVI